MMRAVVFPALLAASATIVTAGQPHTASVSGSLRDEAGQPVPHTNMLACMATVCLVSETGADGSFEFTVDYPARIALKTVEDLTASPRRGAALVPLHVTTSARVTAGAVLVPSLPAPSRLEPSSGVATAVAAGDGLELTLRRSDLKPPLGYAITGVAARRLPGERAGSYALDGEQIVAVYALHPFGATSASPIPVRVRATLAPGTRVNFRTINEIDGTWSAPAPGMSDGTSISTAPGQGIREMTYLVISVIKN